MGNLISSVLNIKAESMKKIFTALLLAVLLSSCGSTFFYSKISSSDDNIFQNEDGDFIVDNDSVLVAYWFNGRNTPLNINVYNKSESPLYVDWNHSFLMKSDSTVKLYKENVVAVDGEFDHLIEKRVVENGRENVEIKSLGVLPENVSYIPPKSRVTFESDVLSDFRYIQTKGGFFSENKLNTEQIKSDKGETKDVKTMDFTNQNSPLSFKTYLVLYNEPKSSFLIENEFYVSMLIKGKDLYPSMLSNNMGKRGDITYIEKETSGKQLGQGVLYTSLGAIVVLAIIAGDPNTEYSEDEYDY